MKSDSVFFRLKFYLIITVIVLLSGIFGFMAFEGLSFTDAIYFSIITLTTVGYGDIHPFTQAGKILVMFIIILGVGTFLGFIATVTEMILAKREKLSRMEKLNILIGVFFSEIGKELIALFARYDPVFDKIRSDMVVTENWTEQDFQEVNKHLKQYNYEIKIEEVDFQLLRIFLVKRRDLTIRLLENPNLMEHESFTDLLHALFHLTEELVYRKEFTKLPHADKLHIAADIKRTYHFLVDQWLQYMKYTRKHYPYLFSLAMRTNPFDLKASPIVK